MLEPTSNKLSVVDSNSAGYHLFVLSALRTFDNEHAEFDESDTYVLERFDTFKLGNHVKEILLKFNLPDHRSILTDSKVTPTNHGRMAKPYSFPCFIANYFNAGYLKMEVKVPDSS
ncbi:hypothetical protein Tco_0712348 [Tanacetum coccineum]